ncbi:Coenzyme F420 hydrogenase/dehydrogenase, beta subunit C-terminal domain [Coraliomargarita algicola]|uniref:Coenzyme F420 hydrogenase/dehydrogenase, beta subunit C-terminal domain n=1 Tax=Coraliomargarita algicola TaxID=3092156 RepID=A0ABZ0RJQ7_9BACT|nr:Coenzyme F420 hydrogenase/dehydrogenase, beta subunit C-terminal domain [Coraliomargarita sp. J2-16]WPJ95000.1 Coenzyme F420 hydrogenase/dehydrogenase, beta subunit C-terminal domain [Coraliomargarita sp. J2-16]
MIKTNPIDRLTAVIDGGYCVGCGACAGVDQNVSIALNKDGMFQAKPSSSCSATSSAANVCPFADDVPNEDSLGKELYGDFAQHSPMAGYYLSTFAGWVTEDDYRARGSSGGMGAWILSELLRRDMVDYVVHVVANREAKGGDQLFHFGVSDSPESVRSHPKSRYYPVEMSQVIQRILQQPGRYAVVGIPCFLKAIRLAAKSEPVIAERVKYTVGLVCGHLKSSGFAQLLAWQCGVTPSELSGIDFRRKIPGQKASLYGITVKGETTNGPIEKEAAVRDLYGWDWGQGFFKYKACDYCDDVLAELADITVGDAWLPEYEQQDQGTNVIVVRHPEVLEICREAAAAGRIHLDDLPLERTILSQAGGFRHRREGLSYRLWKDEQEGRWHPPKRVAAKADHLDTKRKALDDARVDLYQSSHRAFRQAKEQGQLDVFMEEMQPKTAAYKRRFYRKPLFLRIKIRIRSILNRVLKK